jgi:hypothetical protein
MGIWSYSVDEGAVLAVSLVGGHTSNWVRGTGRGEEGMGTGTPGLNFVGKVVVLRIRYEYEYQSIRQLVKER